MTSATMLSFGRTGILIRTGPAIPTTCRALNFVEPLLDLLVIRIQYPSSHHHQRPSYHLPSCLPSLVRNHRTESILIFIQMKSLISVSTLVRFDKIQLKSGSSGQSPLPQYHCRPSLPGWGASSTHSPRPSWRNENSIWIQVDKKDFISMNP